MAAEIPRAVLNELRKGAGRKLPRGCRRWLRVTAGYPGVYLRLLSNYHYDLRRFLAWSSVRGAARGRDQLRAWIVADSHTIEKALSLKEPRPGFGSAVVARLLDNLGDYLRWYGQDRCTRNAVGVLDSYLAFNRHHGLALADVESRVAPLRQGSPPSQEGGIRRVRKDAIQAAAGIDIGGFYHSRHSIRQFSDEPVDPALIERAVLLAGQTPSVCNRQPARVYVYLDAEDRARILALQGGNAGFGEQAPVLLLVTCDTSVFFSVGERNQAWIDGGMFCMSLVYALHALGLGSCCLNWSVEEHDDCALRALTGIPEAEVVIMMLVVGHLPDEFEVARSPRKPLEELLVWSRRGDAVRSPVQRGDR